MCGRMVRKGEDGKSVATFFAVIDGREHWTPRYTVAPTTPIPIVRADAEGQRHLEIAKWDLTPAWAKGDSKKRLLHNARGETVHALPSFRSAFINRRCLIPASGYYEWRGSDKQPFCFERRDGHPLALAAIWEGDETGDLSTCLITTEPNAECAPINDRMPVILSRGFWDRWFDPTPLSDAERTAMLIPAPNGSMIAWEVGRAVGNIRNDRPDLIEKVAKTAKFIDDELPL